LLILWQFDGAKKMQIAIQVLYICVSCWLLAPESCDLSQAQTKMIVVEKAIIFFENSCCFVICLAFNESYFYLCLR
jgi:hypothetical protein